MFADIIIIFLQSYGFFLKLQDSKWYNINPVDILTKEYRYTFRSLFFCSVNFRNFSIMDTISLVFLLMRLVDGMRIFKNLNMVVLCLLESLNLLTIFLALLFLFNFTMVPLAQAIWGTQFIGYKTAMNAANSVFMISYGKGELEHLLDVNLVWSTIFMIIYYVFAVYLAHAAFQFVHTDALKNVILLYSLEQPDVVEKKPKKK